MKRFGEPGAFDQTGWCAWSTANRQGVCKGNELVQGALKELKPLEAVLLCGR